jgi:hypothetical protein
MTTRSLDRRARGRVLASLCTGLVLTVLAVVAAFAGTSTLEAHISAGYPSYSEAEVQQVVSAWLALLSIVGVLGAAGWGLAIWAVRRGYSWSGWLTGALFVVGTAIALYLLTVKETTGDAGLPMALGLAGVVPSLAGLVAVVQLWRARTPVTHGAPA